MASSLYSLALVLTFVSCLCFIHAMPKKEPLVLIDPKTMDHEFTPPFDNSLMGFLTKAIQNKVQRFCTPESALSNLCNQCQTQTQNVLVYPFCCLNIDQVRDYCEQYVAFELKN